MSIKSFLNLKISHRSKYTPTALHLCILLMIGAALIHRKESSAWKCAYRSDRGEMDRILGARTDVLRGHARSHFQLKLLRRIALALTAPVQKEDGEPVAAAADGAAGDGAATVQLQ